MRTTIQLSISVELKERLEYFRQQTGVSISHLVEKLLTKHLPREEKKHEIQTKLDLPTRGKRRTGS